MCALTGGSTVFLVVLVIRQIFSDSSSLICSHSLGGKLTGRMEVDKVSQQARRVVSPPPPNTWSKQYHWTREIKRVECGTWPTLSSINVVWHIYYCESPWGNFKSLKAGYQVLQINKQTNKINLAPAAKHVCSLSASPSYQMLLSFSDNSHCFLFAVPPPSFLLWVFLKCWTYSSVCIGLTDELSSVFLSLVLNCLKWTFIGGKAIVASRPLICYRIRSLLHQPVSIV